MLILQELEDGLLDVTTNGGATVYTITHDEATGDWCVTAKEEPLQKWLLDKQSAINYVFEREGILDDADYNVVDKRCV